MAPPVSRNSAGGTGVSAGGWGDAPLARALFAYLSSGENQLSFLEGDLIALMGEFDLASARRYARFSATIAPEIAGPGRVVRSRHKRNLSLFYGTADGRK